MENDNTAAPFIPAAADAKAAANEPVAAVEATPAAEAPAVVAEVEAVAATEVEKVETEAADVVADVKSDVKSDVQTDVVHPIVATIAAARADLDTKAKAIEAQSAVLEKTESLATELHNFFSLQGVSHELSLAKAKLEEAVHWFGRHVAL